MAVGDPILDVGSLTGPAYVDVTFNTRAKITQIGVTAESGITDELLVHISKDGSTFILLEGIATPSNWDFKASILVGTILGAGHVLRLENPNNGDTVNYIINAVEF